MKKYILIATAVLVYFSSNAKENVGASAPQPMNSPTGVDCAQSSSAAELDINNVRAFILNGGDMWWDQPGTGNARYEVPKVNDPDQLKKNSLFAGSVWIGGEDVDGNVLVTAQTYRQSHYAYWPGPLDAKWNADSTEITDMPEISADECSFWDKHFKINKTVIEQFKEDFKNGDIVSPGDLPEEIKNWPGKSNPHITTNQTNLNRELAPFVDVGGVVVDDAGNEVCVSEPDGKYNPMCGDYPDILGDQTIWWVMNDVGNLKTFGDIPLGAGDAIGLELETRAFAFQTNDAINSMTFYEQKLTNKGNKTLFNTYLGQWVDPDLGNYIDDYVGCDVGRGLGICYNGDDDDDGVLGYGLNPPAVGVDFFQGPKADLNDGIDNDRDGIIDEGTNGLDDDGDNTIDNIEERENIVMSNFLYYNNNSDPINGNPTSKTMFYNYLQNIWGNGDLVMYDGGDGTDQSVNLPAKFMFPGATDQELFWGTGGVEVAPWDEVSAGNAPADRRFLQSAGPFTLEPGQVNVVTIGVVWSRAGSGGATGSISQLKAADDLAQELFDRKFKDFNGPNPPTVKAVELDQEIILSLTPSEFFVDDVPMNTESYLEIDQSLVALQAEDPFYRFQGYLVYQLKDETASSSDLENNELVRLVAQCDKQDGVGQLINYENNGGVAGKIAVEKVDGADNGVFHTLSITQDAFATSADKSVLNNKEYYFMVIAYASNVDPLNVERNGNQYLGSKKNIVRVQAIPHKPGLSDGGYVLNAEYGTGIDLTAINGSGTGNVSIDYTDETVSEILANDSIATPTYKGGNAPISVKVYDPYSVAAGDFSIKFYSRLLFDLDKSDAFELNEEIKVSEVVSSADIDPSFFDYDLDEGIGYIKEFVDTFSLKVDSSYLKYIPELTEVQYNPGTRDTVTVITPDKYEYNPIDTVVVIDTTQSPPDTSNVIVYDTVFTPSDTVITTFNIDTFYQAADTVTVETKISKTVVEAKVVVTNNKLLEEKGTFSKHIAEVTITRTVDPTDPTNVTETPVFQGYTSVPLDFTDNATSSKLGKTYEFQLNEFFEIENSEGKVLDYDMHYRVSDYNEVVLKDGDQSYGVTVQLQHGYDPEYEKFERSGNGFNEATFEVLSGSDWLNPITRPEDTEIPFWLKNAPEAASVAASTIDPTGTYTRVASGAIGPYSYASKGSTSSKGPGYPGWNGTNKYANLKTLPNIDVVITSNEDEWTRVPVLQFDNREDVESNKPAYLLNKSTVASVGKDGQPDGSAVTGMGWFPGYAIDLDRGVRLNMMFSESRLSDNLTGNDLIWNPTSDDDGGKSYIYVMASKYNSSDVDEIGKAMQDLEDASLENINDYSKQFVKFFDDVSWVLNLKKSKSQGYLSGDYKIRVRLDHYFRATEADNGIPQYNFNTADYAPVKGSAGYQDSLCDNFRVVPNPYYAYSEHENGQLDTRVRLTNLPEQCNIKIFTMNGTLVKFFDKDDNSNFLDWNLLNEEGVNVASGTYLIYIEAPGVCERVVKFFGVMRPLDLDTF